MADDLTRQEILFYTVIAMSPDGINQDGIYNEMANIAEEMDWPAYLNSVPRALEERLYDQECGDHIQLCAPVTWEPQSEDRLKAYIGHLVTTYLGEEKYEKARNVLAQKLEMDFLPAALESTHRVDLVPNSLPSMEF